jgi:N-acetylneuraminic acid mutarotase
MKVMDVNVFNVTQPNRGHSRNVTRASGATLFVAALLAGCGGGSSAPTYSVSASVSGLVGSSLQLQLNSGAGVSVGPGTSVTFPDHLDSGATYQVKVVSQPQSPAQTCLVSSGSGTIGSSDVSNVSISCAFGVWTWVAGSDVASEVDDSNPSSRRGAIGWSDHLGHFWLTGGIDLDDRGEEASFWEFDVSTGAWTPVSPTISPGGRLSSATWVDSSNRLWLFGGGGPQAFILPDIQNDLWLYDPTAKSWTLVNGSATPNSAGTYGTQGIAAAGNIPGARISAAYWIDSSDNLWLFGGAGMDATGTQGALADLWRFDPKAGQWTWVAGSQTANAVGNYGVQGVASATNAPPARDAAATWVDSAGALWLFGGAGNNNYYADMWKFDPASSQWTWMGGSGSPNSAGIYGSLGVAAAANVPGARAEAAFWTDPSSRFWMFGGIGSDSTGTQMELNDMWMFSPSTGQWTWMNGPATGNLPGNYGTLNIPALTNIPWAPGSSVHFQDSSGNLYLFGDADNRALWQFAPAK